jgi:hypothetical protein
MNKVEDHQYLPKAILRGRRKPLMIWAAPVLLGLWSLNAIAYGAMHFTSREEVRVSP